MTDPTTRPAVQIEGVGSPVWTVTLDRPDHRNAIDEAVQEGVLQAIRAASTDPNVRAVVITGAGSAFSAGGDLSLMKGMQEDLELRTRVFDRSRALFEELRDLAVPTVAAEEAFRIGLVHRVVGEGEALSVARSLAERIATLPAPAVRATKQAINRLLAAAAEPVFDSALAAEAAAFDTVEHQAAIRNLRLS